MADAPYQSAISQDDAKRALEEAQRIARLEAEKARQRAAQQQAQQEAGKGLTSGELQAGLLKKASAEQSRHAREIRDRTIEQRRDKSNDGKLHRVTATGLSAVLRDGELSITARQDDPQGTGDAGASAANFPYRVLDASAAGVNKVKVYSNSYLFDTTDLTAPVAITSLNTAAAVSNGNVAYLLLTLNSSLTVTAAAITIGATWSGYGAMYHVDSSGTPFIDKVRVLLAEIVLLSDTRDGTPISGDGTLKAVQRWRNNIYLMAWDVAGVPGLLPVSLS